MNHSEFEKVENMFCVFVLWIFYFAFLLCSRSRCRSQFQVVLEFLKRRKRKHYRDHSSKPVLVSFLLSFHSVSFSLLFHSGLSRLTWTICRNVGLSSGLAAQHFSIRSRTHGWGFVMADNGGRPTRRRWVQTSLGWDYVGAYMTWKIRREQMKHREKVNGSSCTRLKVSPLFIFVSNILLLLSISHIVLQLCYLSFSCSPPLMTNSATRISNLCSSNGMRFAYASHMRIA